jgi:NADPH:quinone reductase-like Zn-dependent oxidoreductase
MADNSPANGYKLYELSGGFGIENLELVERKQPEPSANQIVVKIAAVSLNYRDLMVTTGLYDPRLQLPMTPCSDGAGEVVAIGKDVIDWKVGDKVTGTFFQGWVDGEATDSKCSKSLGHSYGGVLAQYAVFEQEGAIRIPKGFTYEEAACLPCAALTAWNALTSDPKLEPGKRVLIQGSGGVSIFALQFAKTMELKIIATSGSDEKLKRLKQLGASHGINYKAVPEWGKEVRKLSGGEGVHHVVEVGGAGTFMQSLDAVRRGGQISLIGVLAGAGTIDPRKILMKGVRVQGIYVGSRKMFEDMNKAIERKGIKPVIDKVFKFEEAPDALRYMQSGNHFGKIVIKVQ